MQMFKEKQNKQAITYLQQEQQILKMDVRT
jgi:hypothetical protein